mmetsp:Transcript_121733/g.192795  ORF Transcript_121733/g.192795 Transcript_121733/m.192795 type:complete len:479 (-) Transcript_121733:8-1444(-)
MIRASILFLIHLVAIFGAVRVREVVSVFASSLVQTTANGINWPDDWEGKISQTLTAGAGSSGKVYFAKLKCDGTYVAVKTLESPPEGAMDHEVSLLKTFSDSPRFPKLFRHAETDSEAFIMMEAALGGDFINIIGKSSIAPEIKMRVWFEALDGIHYMHSKQILHRDLNPTNVMLSLQCGLSYPCKAKIGDLAQACSLANPPMVEGVPVCERRGECGVFSYCAPEIYQSSMLTAKSDVWSLGLMLYELLFDRLPQAISDAESKEALAVAVSDDFIKNDNMFPRVPEALQGLLAGMLHSELDSRMSSAEALALARELKMGLLGLPDDFDNKDVLAKLPCWDDDETEPEREMPAHSNFLETTKKSLRHLSHPLDGSVLDTEGHVDYLLIEKAPNDVTNLLVDPERVNSEGKVTAEQRDLMMRAWPADLPQFSVILEINRFSYGDVYKRYNGGLNEARSEFEKLIRLKYKNRWLVKYWRPA